MEHIADGTKSIVENENTKFAFVILPFNEVKLFQKIQTAVNECGFECYRADGIVSSGFLLENITNLIKKASFIIVDISKYNPNVFYELGIAHTLRNSSKILLLKTSDKKCPSDLSQFTYYPYKKQDDDSINTIIQNFIQQNQNLTDLKNVLVLLNLATSQNVSFIAKHLQIDLTTSINTFLNLFHDSPSLYPTNGDYTLALNILLTTLLSVLLEKKIKAKGLNTFQSIELEEAYLNLFAFIYPKISQIIEVQPIIDYFFKEFHPDEIEIYTEIACQIIKIKPYESILNWANTFLKNCSPASINISRFKLEIALIQNQSLEIQNYLLNNLKNNTENLSNKENRALVEHSLNLCKEKEIPGSVSYALLYLQKTKDPYIFRSALLLVFKLDSTNAQIKNILKIRKEIISKNSFIKDIIKNQRLKF